MKWNKIFCWFKILLAGFCCVALVTACNEDEPDTNQLSGGEVTLKSFGPSPIARGAELRIIGTLLDKVQSVSFAGATNPVTVTAITKVNSTEIRVIVPQEAVPGIITLTAGGKEIRSLTKLGFSEPIAITGISPTAIKANNVLKIEGEYLNLIKEIIFADDVHVLQKDFKSQSRQTIEVIVPLAAQTGKLIVSNGADLVPEGAEPGIPTWVYSETALNVTLPAISQLAPQPVKPGTALTITGTDFDLVESLKFGKSEILVSDFTVNDAKTQITVTVPEETESGNVKLVAFSEVEVNRTLTLTAPAITTIAPNPAKNGENITITGTHLDLVTTVAFAGNATGEIQAQSETEITVTVPAAAVDGDVVLNTHSGQTAGKALTLVKPVISGITPLSLTAGGDITIKGSHLDLVSEVIFKSGSGVIATPVNPVSDVSLTVQTPYPATDGKITLKTVNGATIDSEQSLDITAATLPVVTGMPLSVKPGALLALNGLNLETVTAISFVYSNETIHTTKFLPDATGENLQVYAPAKTGDVEVRLHAGDVYVGYPLIIGTTDPITDANHVFFDFDGKNSWWGSFGAVESDADLSLTGNYFRINGELTGGWIDFFWRNGGDILNYAAGVTVDDWVIKIDVNVLGATTPPFKFRLNGSDGDFWAVFGGLSNRGGWYTVTIPLSDFVDGSKTLTDISSIDSDFGLALDGEGATNICIDNVRFEPK
ncbi:MAG: glycan-binding surface protein [Bacteroidales bacterium]|jgi:hypothetical protein|nr:glycan-binding surface protein [Bacteroidales bacterium]